MVCRHHLAQRQPAKALAALQDGQEKDRILNVLNIPLANGTGPHAASKPSAESAATAARQDLRLAILAGAAGSDDQATLHKVGHIVMLDQFMSLCTAIVTGAATSRCQATWLKHS